ncbi:MAG: hypothetical protein M3Y22_00310 [Pseudomonadota bacterium]|nr:hypothetical protein [Pseudomonadota bacterium]
MWGEKPTFRCVSPSCSNTAFSVMTGVAAAVALGAVATGFDVRGAAAGFFAADVLAGIFLAGAGRVAMVTARFQ